MSDWINEQLEDSKKVYTAIPIPSNLQNAVNAGIQRAVSFRKSQLRLLMVSAAAILFLTLLVGGVRTSPAFASYLSQIPGMERIVQMISNDKGLQLAVNHNLLQPINVTDSHDGVSLTIDNIIRDEARLVVFYTLEGPKTTTDTLNDIQLLDEKGEFLHASYQTFTMQQIVGEKDRSSFIDVMIPENTPPLKHVTVSFGSRPKVDAKKWQVSFILDPDKAQNPKKVLNIDKSITIGGQIIHIDKATIYPTRLLLNVSFDEMNSQHIFQLLDLKLVDDKGREWKFRSSFSTMNNDHQQLIYFESMYFAEPKSLTLHGTGISALDKNELNVVIDPKSEALLKAPDGLSYVGSSIWGMDLRVNFRVKNLADGTGNLAFSEMIDAEGKTYTIGNSGWTSGNEFGDSWNMITGAANAPEPLTLRIGYYPTEFKKPFEVEIPLR
jgi:hypothetical protein